MPRAPAAGRMGTMFRLFLRHRRTPPSARPRLSCPACDADAMCPVEWETLGDEHWLMSLRCGQCGTWLESVVANDVAAAMDVELARQQAVIAAAADALALERMAVEAQAFIAALERDLIDANDFAR
jgi:hypothetical protein